MKVPDFIFRWMIGGKMYDFFHQERSDGVKDIVDKRPTKIGGFNGHKSLASKHSK